MAERAVAEVVVAGAGPAGIAAAVHAAGSGRRVLLVDTGARAGGQVWRHLGDAPAGARPWLARLARSGALVLPEATVVDAPRPGTLLVERLGQALHVRYHTLVLACGARELFLPFPGWTLPGVIGAGAAQALREGGARFDGLRVVVAGSGPLLPAVAVALRQARARVVGVVEQAPALRLAGFATGLLGNPRKLAQAAGFAARLRGVPLLTSAWVAEAIGRERLERVALSDGRRLRTWDCDLLACGFGLLPNLELARLLGCDCASDRVLVDGSQRTSLPSVFAAGELCGIGGVDHALATGAIAGLAAAGAPAPARFVRSRERERAFARRLARAFALRDELRHLARPDTLVCRCEDVPLQRIAASPFGTRGAKLHTRAGMGACQGRVCGPALRFLLGWSDDSVRPPILPSLLGVLAEEEEKP
ncbi:MAG TPA: FAD-dependent oxidoreductase [Vicinamibacteria bacterium]|nr:FAD-dependent oxidoreductase [Vicinamibacteria bacterium]